MGSVRTSMNASSRRRRTPAAIAAFIVIALVGLGVWLTRSENAIWRLDGSNLAVKSVEATGSKAITTSPGMASSNGLLIVPSYSPSIGLNAYRYGKMAWSTTLLPQAKQSEECDGNVFAWLLPGPDGMGLAQARSCTGTVRTVGVQLKTGSIVWEMAAVNGYSITPADRVALMDGPNGGFVMLRNLNTKPELVVVDPATGTVRRSVELPPFDSFFKIAADDRYVVIGCPDANGSQIVDFGATLTDQAVVTPVPPIGRTFDVRNGVKYEASPNGDADQQKRGYVVTATALADRTTRWTNTVIAPIRVVEIEAAGVSPMGFVVNFGDRLRVHNFETGKVTRTVDRANDTGDTLSRPTSTTDGVIISDAIVTPSRTAQFSRYNLAYDQARNEVVYIDRTPRWRRLLSRAGLRSLRTN
jgi:hypothetical protein